jgi:AbrB family looped-hinge helix DNA binding protein
MNSLVNEMIKRISKGYQITIPAEIRKQFDLVIGTPIDIEVKKDEIVLKPFDSKKEMERLFKEADKFPKHNLSPEDLEKMEAELYE